MISRKIYSQLAIWLLVPVLVLSYLWGGSSTEGLVLRLIVNGISAVTLVGLVALVPKGACSEIPLPLVLGLMIIVSVFFLQVVPLPPSIWGTLPLRSTLIDEQRYFDLPPSWRALSLAPGKTLAMFSELFPAVLAAFVMLTINRERRYWLFGLIFSISILSALWGLIQILLPSTFGTYIWEVTSGSAPSGAYANINHQASNMVVAMLILAAMILEIRKRYTIISPLVYILGAALFFLLFICMAAAGSLAGYLQFLIALPFTVLIYLHQTAYRQSKLIFNISLFGTLLLIIVFLLIVTSSQLSGLDHTSFRDGPLSRFDLYKTSLLILSDHWLFGTGAGSFSKIYPFYETSEGVSSNFANHAHNDWLEAAIEFGLVGLLLIAVGVFCVLKGLRELSGGRQIKISLYAVGIFLFGLHSLVDYPLRSQFLLIIMTLFAISSFSKYERSL